MLTSPTVADIVRFLEAWALPEWSEAWDPAGLALGDRNHRVDSLLICLDLTPRAVEAAIARDIDLILCHHPPIFEPLPTLNADKPERQALLRLIRADVAVLALHTQLDRAPGGVADCLAGAVAGAFGDPARQVDEPLAVYGRIVDLDPTQPFAPIPQLLRGALRTEAIFAESAGRERLGRLVCFPGSLDGAIIDDAADAGVDGLIAGEIKYHDRLALAWRGIASLAVGHDVSERLVLPVLRRRLVDAWSDITVILI